MHPAGLFRHPEHVLSLVFVPVLRIRAIGLVDHEHLPVLVEGV
jgi:hypothetical protein